MVNAIIDINTQMISNDHYPDIIKYNTVCMVHLADIKFGDLAAKTSWLTFSLANQLSS